VGVHTDADRANAFVPLRAQDKRSKKKRQRRNNLNRQREKEFAARVRDLDRMA
jgi:hypothetical protein